MSCGTPRGVAARLAARAAEEGMATTTITLFEIRRGIRSDRGRQHFERMVAEMEVLPLDPSSAESAADAWQQVRAAGTPVDTGDLLIAGIAISRGLPLLTRNQRDFERIPGLMVETL